MNLKKTAAIAAAAGALAAISVPAMALENEFHGMYRMFGYMTNAYSGAGGFNLAEDSRTDKFIEQRARLMYVAKASDDLKLVTHFELDTKFGGATGTTNLTTGAANKYPTGDAGSLDADAITLETKNIYLDFKIPGAPIRAMVGIQPFADALQGTFGNIDATGAVFTGNFNPLTLTLGYFTTGHDGTGIVFDSNRFTQDLNVLDLKFALTKDVSLGASYYMQLDKVGVNNKTVAKNTLGLNAAAKVGPAALTASLGMQFGKTGVYDNTTTLRSDGTTAFSGALAAKVGVGPGNVKASALFLSGDKSGTGYNHAWQSIGTTVNYFTPANMWLLTRNAAMINSSTAIGGSPDLTRGGRGIMGVFAGFDGTAGNLFYDANVGYARVAEKQVANSSSIGTELNATVGYKLYDNLKASTTAAYAILGDGYGKANAIKIGNTIATAPEPDNPFMLNIALNYAF